MNPQNIKIKRENFDNYFEKFDNYFDRLQEKTAILYKIHHSSILFFAVHF